MIARIEISFKVKDIKYLQAMIAKHNQLEFRTTFGNLSAALDLQEGDGLTIQSNDIEHQFHKVLFISWGKNLYESNFLRNICIWLHIVRLVNKDQSLATNNMMSLLPLVTIRCKEIVNLFKITSYLQNIVSIHPISSYPRCDIFSNDELDVDNSKERFQERTIYSLYQ
ncbi:hypothetical protein Cgig2_034130 [Carnegiea gigantea]|uniref:Ycf2 N-terminal domain-containing protein n=1 Tax=Carnegiea gigantea TaxID=171969 RepID=A0A9Q1QHN2_9CARY|nr:hypothetical protein Cgig2_034130 [Carnegiea gigantea]